MVLSKPENGIRESCKELPAQFSCRPTRNQRLILSINSLILTNQPATNLNYGR